MSASRQFHEPAEPKPERYSEFLLRNPLSTTETSKMSASIKLFDVSCVLQESLRRFERCPSKWISNLALGRINCTG